MALIITPDQLNKLAPNARSSYRDAFAQSKAVLDHYEISANPLRLAHFMAQILHECGGLTVQFENLNYSPERLPVVWPKRFKPKGELDPQDFAHNPQALANQVYANKLGNTGPNDGFNYRGRGLMQLTGKSNYEKAAIRLKRFDANAPDLIASPDEVISAQWCLPIAASFWQEANCNQLADQDDIRKITRAINGGEIGLASRTEWVRRTKNIWG